MKKKKEQDKVYNQQQMNLNNQLNEMAKAKQQQDLEYQNLMKSKQELEKMAQNLTEQTRQKYQEYEQSVAQLKKQQQQDIERVSVQMKVNNEEHTKVLNKIQEEHKKTIMKLEKDKLWDHIDSLKREKEDKEEHYQTKLKEQVKLQEIYLEIKKQVDEEESRLLKYYGVELNDPNIKQIVLLGPTGNGKSTLANRLCNDESEDGNEGDFKVSHGHKSETQKINKKVIKCKIIDEVISLLDTPGYFDSEGNDRFHCNNLVEFLKGCGGINAFCIVKMKIPPRFDKAYQNMLKELEEMLGRAVWKHVVLVITGVDDKKSKREFPQWSKDWVEALRKEMQLNEFEAPLPIVGIGNLENYENGIKELFEYGIPSTKYQCNQLRSPLDVLKMDMNNKKLNLDDITNDAQRVEKEIKALEKAIEDSENVFKKNGNSVMKKMTRICVVINLNIQLAKKISNDM